jgi:hypothetical protein
MKHPLDRGPDDPRLPALVTLIGHTGATQFETRFSEGEADGEPTVWMSIATFHLADGDTFEVAAGANPFESTVRLAEVLIDGGTCRHCQRPSALEPDPEADNLTSFLVNGVFCFYEWDPELELYRRSCEDPDQ